MTIEAIIIAEYRRGNTSPIGIAAKHSLNIRSVNTAIWRLRQEGRLPRKEDKPKPSYYDSN